MGDGNTGSDCCFAMLTVSHGSDEDRNEGKSHHEENKSAQQAPSVLSTGTAGFA